MLGIRRSCKVLIKGIIAYLDVVLPNFGSVPNDNKKKNRISTNGSFLSRLDKQLDKSKEKMYRS